jgi:PAS domain S-box-containing protein/putative nucleotidyltransferase with HDIG domain
MKTNLKDINLKYEELAEKNIANNGFIGKKLKEEMFTGITEELEDRLNLKKDINKFKQLIEYMHEGLGQIDKNKIIIYANPRMAEMLGYAPEEMIGKHLLDFMDDEGKSKAQMQLERRKKGIKEQFDFEFLKKNGSKVFTRLETAPMYDEDGNYNGAVAYISDITKQKIIEDELKESEENLAEAQKITKIGSWTSDFISNKLKWSKEMFIIFGINPGNGEPSYPDEFEKLFHPDDVEKVRYEIIKAIKNERLCDFEHRIIYSDGTIRNVIARIKPVKNSEGRVVKLLGTLQDITGRKKTEKELEASEKKFRDLVELLPEVVLETDQKINIKFANKNFFQISGYSADDIKKGLSIFQLLSPESIAKAQENIAKIIKGEKTGPNEYILIKKNGGKIIGMSNSNVIYDNKGNFSGLRIMAIDVSERKKQNDDLKISEERYKSLFENSLDGVYQTTLEGRYIDVNPALIKILGYDSKEELLKLDIKKQLYVSEKDRPSIDKRSKPFMARFKKKDGTIIWVEVSSKAFFKNGKPDHYEGIVRDITHRMEIEENLKQSYERLQKTLNGTINTLASIVETKDPYTAGHQVRVAKLSVAIAKELGLSKERINAISVASLIHDIGKITVPASILAKPGSLTDIEFAMIRTHSQVGYDILKEIDFGYPIADIVIQHHERLNGSGYPKGLKGNDIMIEARIIAVADTVESMASHRPYRPALGLDKALKELEEGRGILYDRDVVDSCFKIFREKKFKF